MRVALVVIGLLSVAAPAPAQAQLRRAGPTAGLALTQSRETRLNDTRYAGPDLELGGVFHARTGEVEHRAGANVAIAYLSNRLGFAQLLLGFGVRYDIGLDLEVPKDTQAFVSIGGGSRFGLYIPEDPEHISWATAYDVAVGPRWTRAFGRSELQASVAASLFAVVSRPPDRTLRNNDDPGLFAILGQVHSDMRFATWPDYGRMRAEVSWERAWPKWWTRFALQAAWQTFQTDTRLDLLQYRLLTEFRFGR